jgi:hypothetical protein
MVAIRILRPRNGSFLEAFSSLFVTSSRRESRAQIVKNFSPWQACLYCPFKDVHGFIGPTLPNQGGREELKQTEIARRSRQSLTGGLLRGPEFSTAIVPKGCTSEVGQFHPVLVFACWHTA